MIFSVSQELTYVLVKELADIDKINGLPSLQWRA